MVSHPPSLAKSGDRRPDVPGYSWRSLSNDFECAEGRAARFGLALVDFAMQNLMSRPATELYGRICPSNGKVLVREDTAN